MTDHRDIEQRALQWRLRAEGPGWSADDQVALDLWLAEATAHRVAWLRAGAGLQRLDHLQQLQPATLAQQLPRRPHQAEWQPEGLGWKGWALAATVILSVAVGLLGWQQWQARGVQMYATAVGGKEIVPLRDGSRLELNTDTQLRAEVDDQKRVVWLQKGEAFFDIAHDESRPFTVFAGDRRITVLGTRFSVRQDGRRVEVMVEEGRVKVEALQPKVDAPPTIATRGKRVIAEANNTLMADAAPPVLQRELAWRRGLLIFDNTPLVDAAREFNRYNTQQLQVEGPGASTTRISGSFEATNLDAFARLLQRAYGLQLEPQGAAIRVTAAGEAA
ncbi:FecR domain-containing protein [Flagellatimonas centrodinii]|uniref:FecR family protein n=1 Tax=Flagellatimonas centrodinii TaxID=2806210 RepID=UPI001FEFEA58|nr:FecR domain-containing protein [Flagellatimonas centrodinii]ULQ48075.1 FecR domain-containing protein [Flagellatimonas centrodinii]